MGVWVASRPIAHYMLRAGSRTKTTKSASAGIVATIDNPEATYDPKIWGAPGFALVVSWLAQKWRQRCQKLAPRGSKDPAQYLTKEQQKACLDSAAVELIREITQRRSLN